MTIGFFRRDDYKIMLPGYYGVGIELLDSNEDVAFIGYDTIGPSRTSISALKILKAISKPFIRLYGYGRYIKKYSKIINRAITLLKGGNIINSGGGMGLTSRDYLVKVIEHNGSLPHSNIPNPRYNKKFVKYEGNETPGYKSYPLWKFFKYNRYFVWYWVNVVLCENTFSQWCITILGIKIMGYPNQGNMIYSYKNR